MEENLSIHKSIYSKKKHDSVKIGVMVIISVLGFILFTVNYLNATFSRETNCNNFKVLDKTESESNHILLVDLLKSRERIYCDYKAWNDKKIGQSINLCLFKSPIGFDFIKVNEKY